MWIYKAIIVLITHKKRSCPHIANSLFLHLLLSELFLLVSSVFNSRFFTSKISEVIDSSSSNSTSSVNFDFLKSRHVDRENSLYTYITTHFSDCKSLCRTCSSQLDNSSFEELSSCFLTFLNFVINSDRITSFYRILPLDKMSLQLITCMKCISTCVYIVKSCILRVLFGL